MKQSAYTKSLTHCHSTWSKHFQNNFNIVISNDWEPSVALMNMEKNKARLDELEHLRDSYIESFNNNINNFQKTIEFDVKNLIALKADLKRMKAGLSSLKEDNSIENVLRVADDVKFMRQTQRKIQEMHWLIASSKGSIDAYRRLILDVQEYYVNLFVQLTNRRKESVRSSRPQMDKVELANRINQIRNEQFKLDRELRRLLKMCDE